LLCACVVFSAAASPSDQQITDPAEIEAFLKSPGTKSLNVPDPRGWKTYRKYIQVGTKNAQGGCEYSSRMQTSRPLRQVSVEIAVDRTSCKSLILEGEPDDMTWNAVQNFFGARHPNPRSPLPIDETHVPQQHPAPGSVHQ